MDNKNTPAFPLPITSNENGVYTVFDTNSNGDYGGITKLEFFACNAPVDIPSWFVHVSPEKNITPQPTWYTLPKEAQEHVKLWFGEGIELPEELRWFSDQWNKFEAEDMAYKVSDWNARYFQWRRYYAEQLLNELSKTQP
jgi:hypothetical protein